MREAALVDPLQQIGGIVSPDAGVNDKVVVAGPAYGIIISRKIFFLYSERRSE
jgi:hypothetical protein